MSDDPSSDRPISDDLAPAGPRILLTRSAEDNTVWSRRLRAAGALPVELACIRWDAEPAGEVLKQLHPALASADWLLFGSPRGVRTYRDLGELPLKESVRLGAVGRKTAELCRQLVRPADLVGPEETAASLGGELARRLRQDPDRQKPWRVVFAGADRTTGDLEKALSIPGVVFCKIVLYRTRPVECDGTRKRLSRRDVDFVFLASPSALEGLLAQVEVMPDVALISIGPSTSTAIERAGLTVAGEARSRSLEGLLEATR